MMPSVQRREKKKRGPRFSQIDHLGPEAVVAFVDGEMSDKSSHRARVHIVVCETCRAEVHRQRRARQALRGCNTDEQVQVSETLLSKLCSIARHSDEQKGMQQTNSGEDIDEDAEVTNSGYQPDLIDRMEMFVRAVRRNQGRE